MIEQFLDDEKLGETDKEGFNALMWASREGHYECVEYLIKYFNDANNMNAKSNAGNTALDLAKDEKYERIVQLLDPYYK